LPRYSVQWIAGVTQQGSSGSGLFNSNRRLIGTLSGAISIGNEHCLNTKTANFGKLKSFWLGNSATRNKLNPDNVFAY